MRKTLSGVEQATAESASIEERMLKISFFFINYCLYLLRCFSLFDFQACITLSHMYVYFFSSIKINIYFFCCCNLFLANCQLDAPTGKDQV